MVEAAGAVDGAPAGEPLAPSWSSVRAPLPEARLLPDSTVQLNREDSSPSAGVEAGAEPDPAAPVESHAEADSALVVESPPEQDVNTSGPDSLPDSGSSQVGEDWIRVTAVGYAHVRTSGSTDAPVVGRVNPGDTVDLEGTGQGWNRLRMGPVSGWVWVPALELPRGP